ncbi:MAG: hypothetical protein Q9221_007277 [Calogaya cf. arnoldii]
MYNNNHHDHDHLDARLNARSHQFIRHHNALRRHELHHPINPYLAHNDNTIPFPLRPDLRFDLRFPPSLSSKDPKEPTTLLSPDGEYTAHLIALLHPFSRRLSKLLQDSHAARAPTLETVRPEDLITRALAAGRLRHVSDGPAGGIWCLEAKREGGWENLEIVVAMVVELELCKEIRKWEGMVGVVEDEGEGRWEVLGLGEGGDEGRVFLIHGCGFGPRILEEEREKVEGRKWRSRRGIGLGRFWEEDVEDKEKVEGGGKGDGEKGKGKGKGKAKAKVKEETKKHWVGRFWEKI